MAFQIGGKYYHSDAESGELIEISKQTYDAMQRWRKYLEAKINPNMKIKGAITIHGTMRDDSEQDFRQLWDDFNQQK